MCGRKRNIAFLFAMHLEEEAYYDRSLNDINRINPFTRLTLTPSPPPATFFFYLRILRRRDPQILNTRLP